MPRGPRIDVPGAIHHIMARGIERRDIFLDHRDRKNFLDRLAIAIEGCQAELYAWSLIDNHFHLLLRSGSPGISAFMQRLLTGYALGFNIRNERSGHLFQNRFKSVLVQEEPYLLELVRYIHLNPVRAGLVGGMRDLDNYPWSGHAVLMGNVEAPFQQVDEVLSRFGGSLAAARFSYRQFVSDGERKGSRPDLVDRRERRRGLPRDSYLGSKADSGAANGEKRVLGSPEFISSILEERQYVGLAAHKDPDEQRVELERVFTAVTDALGLDPEEVLGGGRRRDVTDGRAAVAYVAVSRLGLSASFVAGHLGVSLTTVLRGRDRGHLVLDEHGLHAEQLLG